MSYKCSLFSPHPNVVILNDLAFSVFVLRTCQSPLHPLELIFDFCQKPEMGGITHRWQHVSRSAWLIGIAGSALTAP